MLPLPDWRNVLDGYIVTGTMEAEDYAQMSQDQVMIIQSLKKAFARIKRKHLFAPYELYELEEEYESE